MLALELRHLRTLAALRDTGSLVEAAERVYLTQCILLHPLQFDEQIMIIHAVGHGIRETA